MLKPFSTAGAAGIERFAHRYPTTVREEYQTTASPGSVITLWAEGPQGVTAIGADALGQRGVRAKSVGAAAAQRLIAVLESKAAVDHHLADDLIPLLALVGGVFKTDRIRGHILSNIYVCEQFLGARFTVDSDRNLIAVRR